MTHWLTAAELMRDYRVSEQRLQTYAMRGTLPSCRGEDGQRRYDRDRVAAYFARRDMPDSGLGVLGAVRIGQPAQLADASKRRPRVQRRERSVVEAPAAAEGELVNAG